MRLVTGSIRTFLAAIALASAACSSASTDADALANRVAGDVTVQIRNASPKTFTNVRVATGPSDEVTVASLAPGQTTSERAVQAVHSSVAIQLVVDGKTAALIPVEGFDGFNPRIENGRYLVVIDLRPESTAAQPLLNVTMSKLP